MKKGILILAIGHPYYGRMAAALAATIKTTGTGIPIHLAYTESAISHLTEKEIALFSSKSIINDKYCTPVPIRSKMFIYQLSPFDETLYLDADLLLFQKMP